MVNHRVEVLSFSVDFIGCVGMVSGEPKLTLTLAGNINGNKKSLFCYTSSKRLNKERRLQNWSGGWISESKQVCLRYLCLLCPCLYQQGQPGLCVGGRAMEEQKDQKWWGTSRELEEIWPIQVGGPGGQPPLVLGELVVSLLGWFLSSLRDWERSLMNGEKQICPSFKQTNTLMDLPRAKQAWATGLPAITDRIWRWRESSWCHLCWLHAQRQGCCQGTQDALKHLPHEERMGELGWFSLEKRWLWYI